MVKYRPTQIKFELLLHGTYLCRIFVFLIISTKLNFVYFGNLWLIPSLFYKVQIQNLNLTVHLLYSWLKLDKTFVNKRFISTYILHWLLLSWPYILRFLDEKIIRFFDAVLMYTFFLVCVVKYNIISSSCYQFIVKLKSIKNNIIDMLQIEQEVRTWSKITNYIVASKC